MSDFASKLYVRLAKDIINTSLLEEWMNRYKVNLIGSTILEILYDVLYEDSDVDFEIAESLMEEATHPDVLACIFINNLGHLIRRQPALPLVSKRYLQFGNRIEIVSSGSWRQDKQCLQNFGFCRNTWNPKDGLTMNDTEAVKEKQGFCDVYSEIVCRFQSGHHPFDAVSRIMMRVAKYTRRGFLVEY